jgi:hypothetical protein
MATITYSLDRNASMDYSSVGVTETDASGATMTKGIELNIDKAKVTSKQEILEALDKIAKAVMESANLTG